MRFCDYNDKLMDAVIALLAKNTRVDYDQRKPVWDWLYRENPFIGEGRRGIVLIDDERVVSFTGFIPIELLRNGVQVQAAWSFDAMVSPEVRRKGYGGQLIDLVKLSYPVVLSLGIADIQAKAKLKRGYRANQDVEQYFYCCQPGKIKEWLKYAIQIANRIRRFGERVRVENLSIEVGKAAELPKEIDQLWDIIKHSHRNIVVRNYAYMRWRYGKHPVKTYLTLIIRDAGVLRALAILEQNKATSTLVDYVGASNDRQSMQMIVEMFRTTCMDSSWLECTCSNECLKSVLETCGFRRYRIRPRFYVFSNLEHDKDWAKNWFIMDGDSDSNHYPRVDCASLNSAIISSDRTTQNRRNDDFQEKDGGK